MAASKNRLAFKVASSVDTDFESDLSTAVVGKTDVILVLTIGAADSAASSAVTLGLVTESSLSMLVGVIVDVSDLFKVVDASATESDLPEAAIDISCDVPDLLNIAFAFATGTSELAEVAVDLSSTASELSKVVVG